MKKLYLLLTVFALTSCSTSTDPSVTSQPTCVTANTSFQQLYNPLNTIALPQSLSGFANAVTHEYTFKVSSAATICSLGYQSQANTSSLSYVLEVFDTVSATVVGSVTAAFSSSATSYVSFATPVALVVGREYKIKRFSPATAATPNGAGRCVSNSVMGGGNVSFPKTAGILTITDSDFYTQNLTGQINAGDNNNSLPFIDIVFQ